MNLAELIAKVYVETNRPDLIKDTLQAVQSATITMHSMEDWPRDIETCQITFPALAYIQKIPVEVLPRFRKFAYLRKNDPGLAQYQQNPGIIEPAFDVTTDGTAVASMRPITIIEPDDWEDREYKGLERLDVGYLAGRNFWIKSSTNLQFILGGFYQNPIVDALTDQVGNVTTYTYSSWIADTYPWSIIYHAASHILSNIGQQDTAAKYDRPAGTNGPLDKGGLLQQQINLLIQNCLLATRT